MIRLICAWQKSQPKKQALPLTSLVVFLRHSGRMSCFCSRRRSLFFKSLAINNVCSINKLGKEIDGFRTSLVLPRGRVWRPVSESSMAEWKQRAKQLPWPILRRCLSPEGTGDIHEDIGRGSIWLLSECELAQSRSTTEKDVAFRFNAMRMVSIQTVDTRRPLPCLGININYTYIQ